MATIEEYSPQIKQVLEWIDQFRYGSSNNNAAHYSSDTVIIYTDLHAYNITAKNDYLGCIATNRKKRAGEKHYRGSDLADGKFCIETWNKILNDIVGYELVKVHAHQYENTPLKIKPNTV